MPLKEARISSRISSQYLGDLSGQYRKSFVRDFRDVIPHPSINGRTSEPVCTNLQKYHKHRRVPAKVSTSAHDAAGLRGLHSRGRCPQGFEGFGDHAERHGDEKCADEGGNHTELLIQPAERLEYPDGCDQHSYSDSHNDDRYEAIQFSIGVVVDMVPIEPQTLFVVPPDRQVLDSQCLVKEST